MANLAFADTETSVLEDLEQDIRQVGNELHVFEDGEDTGVLPEVYVKCISLVICTDSDAEIDGHGIPIMSDKPIFKAVYTSLDEFWCKLCEVPVKYLYFHNLKFDESYFANPLLAHGEISLSNGWKLNIREDTRSMSDKGKLYEITYDLSGPKKKDHRTIKMRDSAKIYNMSLRKLGESFGLAKGNEATTKGITPELLDYCLNDSMILMKAMVFYFNMCRRETKGRKMFGWLTAARTTYELCFMHLEEQYGEDQLAQWFVKDGHPKWLRECYKGASPLMDKSLKCVQLNDVCVLDVNSMYPTQMCQQLLPVGRPVPIKDYEIDYHPLWVAMCHIEAKVKQGKRACYLVKRRQNDDVLLDHIEWDGLPQFITSVDWQMIKENYDVVDVEFKEIWAYEGKRGILEEYIMKWMNIKIDSKKSGDKAMELFSKLMMNSLYGKFGSRTGEEMESAGYVINEKGALRKVEVPSKHRDFKGTDAVSKYGYYLPFATFITAYARKMLVDAINVLGWDHVHYTDTDSMHTHNITKEDACDKLTSNGFMIDKTKLGAFDVENENVLGKYIDNKEYCLFAKTDMVYKGKPVKAGYPIKAVFAGSTGGWEGMHIDSLTLQTKLTQLRSYNVRGGVMLMDSEHELGKGHMVHRVNKQTTMEDNIRRLEEMAIRAKNTVNYDMTDINAMLKDKGYKEYDPNINRKGKAMKIAAYERAMWEDVKIAEQEGRYRWQ